jgi:hypothetical protein
MRHLVPAFAEAALNRGAQIDNLLPATPGFPVRWLSAWQSQGLFVLHMYELDIPVPDGFYDLSAMVSDEMDEKSEIGRYAEAESLLIAAESLGGAPDRWVNQGLVNDEYLDRLGQ